MVAIIEGKIGAIARPSTTSVAAPPRSSVTRAAPPTMAARLARRSVARGASPTIRPKRSRPVVSPSQNPLTQVPAVTGEMCRASVSRLNAHTPVAASRPV